MDPDELPLRRLKALYGQLLQEESQKDRPGAESRVARRLGITPSMISKLKGGTTKSPSAQTIGRVIRTMQIDARFFYESAGVGPAPDYRAYLQGARPRAPGMAPGWNDLAANWIGFEQLTPTECEALQGLISDDHDVSSWTDWVEPATWLINHRRK